MAYAEHFGVVGAFFIPHLGEFGFREPARNRVDVAGLQIFRIGRAVYIGVLITAVDGRIAVFVADALRGAGLEVDGFGQAVACADFDTGRTCTEGRESDVLGSIKFGLLEPPSTLAA